MIEQRAHVVYIDDKYAWVEARRYSVCGDCKLNSSCGTALMDRLFARSPLRVRALNTVNAQIGDRVSVGIPEQGLVKGSLAIYAVPLIVMLTLSLLGAALPIDRVTPEVVSILSALLGLMIGFGWLAVFARRVSHHPQYNPIVLRLISPARAPISDHYTE